MPTYINKWEEYRNQYALSGNPSNSVSTFPSQQKMSLSIPAVAEVDLKAYPNALKLIEHCVPFLTKLSDRYGLAQHRF